MTSVERIYALYKSLEFISRNGILGDIVECGVWRGGSCMMAAKSLLHFKDTKRTLYLYDTFAGMMQPTSIGKTVTGQEAHKKWKTKLQSIHNTWCYCGLDEVMANLYSTDYPRENIVFVEGEEIT